MTFGTRDSEMRQWLEEQGVVFGNNWWTYPHIKACFGECAAVFPELFDQISVLYVYNQQAQIDEDLKNSDAIFWFYSAPDRVMLFAIGISTAAAAQGEEYTLLCVIHELAHMKTLLEGKREGKNGHSTAFHANLDDLISKFNAETGRNIMNDYDGLQIRCDDKICTCPNNSPRKR